MSQKLSKIKQLIKTANHLDEMGLHKEADVIDRRILKIAQETSAATGPTTAPPQASSAYRGLVGGVRRFRDNRFDRRDTRIEKRKEKLEEKDLANEAARQEAAEKLQERAAEVVAPAAPPTQTAPAPTPTSTQAITPAPKANEHTVAHGESLALIAKNKLGDYRKWKQIYDLNKDVIGPDPNRISPGMKLKLPA